MRLLIVLLLCGAATLAVSHGGMSPDIEPPSDDVSELVALCRAEMDPTAKQQCNEASAAAANAMGVFTV
jgi:hypothetical protein